MRAFHLACLACAVALSVSACASSKQEEAAKQAQREAEKATAPAGDQAKAQGLNDLAKSMEAAAKGISALGSSDGKPVEPVSFRELQKYFPEVSGWEMGKAEGQKMTAPVSFAEASVEYTKGDSRIEAKIVDSGLNQLIFAPMTMFMVQGYEKETSEGYEKSIAVAGALGFERWNREGKSGELNLVIGKRYLVTLSGHDIADMQVLHDLAGKMDLGGLSNLK